MAKWEGQHHPQRNQWKEPEVEPAKQLKPQA